MTVVVKLFANFREAMGKASLELDDVKKISELLERLVESEPKMAKELYNPETGEVVKTVQITLNGKTLKIPEGLKTPLKSGDVIAIFPPVAGGFAPSQVL